MNDTPAVIEHSADEFRKLTSQAEQNEQRSKQNRQRILTLEQGLRHGYQRRNKVDEGLEKHGKTLQAHGNTLSAVRTVADKAHADQAAHELNHTKIYDHDYAAHAMRIVKLEEDLADTLRLMKQLAKRLAAIRKPPAPDPPAHDQVQQNQRLQLLETNINQMSALTAALAKAAGITVNVTTPGQAEHN